MKRCDYCGMPLGENAATFNAGENMFCSVACALTWQEKRNEPDDDYDDEYNEDEYYRRWRGDYLDYGFGGNQS